MNKVILSFPIDDLSEYIENHFEELSVDDFFEIIKHKPEIIKMIDSDKINNQIIYLLEESDYILDEDDLRKNSIFFKSKKLLIRAVLNNPKLIMSFKELRQKSYIMELLIEKDAKYISLIGDKCYIDYDLAVNALKEYKITKEDLEMNPDLTRNNLIMKLLPEYRLYFANITLQEKKDVMLESFNKDFLLSVDRFPFLDHKFGGKTDVLKLTELFNLLYVDIDNKNIYQQEFYYQTLDKIIDGISEIRYMDKKSKFKYPDIVSLNNSLVLLFNEISENNKVDKFDKYIDDLCLFIGNDSSKKDIKDNIEKYYDTYREVGMVDLSLTSDFCNEILNKHRDYFKNIEKKRISNELIFKIELKDEKKNSILYGKKLKQVGLLIREQNYEKLGINEEIFIKILDDVKKIIINSKLIKETGVKINTKLLDKVFTYFMMNGEVNKNVVGKTLNIDDQDVVKFITKLFDDVKRELSKNITLFKHEEKISNMEKMKLGGSLNYNNYLIADKNRYLKNVIDILFEMNDELLDKILENKDFLNEIIYLLPLLNLIDEFDTKAFINILCCYKRIKNKICATYNVNIDVDNKEIMLKYVNNLISLANAYCSIDNIALFALGDDVVSKVGEHDSNKYLDYYLKMLNRQSGSIPHVSLETDKYYLDSGLYSDVDRLLIGKIFNGISCIDLYNFAGGETYNEVLLKKDGDVILVRDKKKRLISRILLFRKGNVIQMVSNMYDKHPIELYKEIADTIMNKAMSYEDNIDYIFVNTSSVSTNNNMYPIIKDTRFIVDFPHADFDQTSVLIASKKKINELGIENLDLNLEDNIKVSYLKRRKKISYSPTEMEISKIKALDVLMEKNLEIREDKARNFEPFYINEYDLVVCGEDWYIAIDNNGSLEELILPSKDPRTYDEFNHIREELFMVNKIKKIL